MKQQGFTVIETENKKVRIAKAAITSCLKILKQRVRFLGCAVNVLEPVPVKESTMLITDGKHLYFHPKTVLEDYEIYGLDGLVKQILHIVLHGVMGDFGAREETEWMALRTAVMDLRVAHMMELLGYPSEKENFKGLKHRPGLYLLGRRSKKERKYILEQAAYVYSDDHCLWMKSKKYKEGKKDLNSADEEMTEEETEEIWAAVRKTLGLEKLIRTDKDSDALSAEYLLQCMGNMRGTYSGPSKTLSQADNGMGNDYRHILQHLIEQSETVKEEDTLDPNLYLYGLECYGDVALVEPLEVSEKARMNTLVLAVDTSGSCVERIPRFLRETISVLDNVRELVSKGMVAYLECDTAITKEMIFEDMGQAIEVLRVHHAEGGGGTDFCPVFERMGQLEKQGQKIDAMFYFSDGDGAFPEEVPDYPVYFVMEQSEEDQTEEEIPAWVNRIQL